MFNNPDHILQALEEPVSISKSTNDAIILILQLNSSQAYELL